MATYAGIEFNYLSQLEEELGIPKRFFVELEDNDDWSYVVKLHTLIEAAVAHLVLSALGDSRLERIIVSLPLGNKRNGKIAFAVALDLLPEMDLGFIQFITDLRNGLVHRIQNVSFTFHDHFSKMKDDEVRETYWKWGFAKIKDDDGDAFVKIFRSSPKILIQLRAILLFQSIYIGHSTNRIRSMSRKELEKFLKLHATKPTK
jgi:hypothetical protein